MTKYGNFSKKELVVLYDMLYLCPSSKRDYDWEVVRRSIYTALTRTKRFNLKKKRKYTAGDKHD